MFYFNVDEFVSLKLLENHDAEEIFEVLDQNREYLREWLPWVDDMENHEDYLPVIKMWLEQFANNDGFQAGIYYQNHFVGMIGFHGVDRRNHKTTIGYWLAEGYQGKGIMTKAVEKIVGHAFQSWKLNRAEIHCGAGNVKSRAIPERLGFTNEGTIRDGECLYGKFHDLVIYGMLARDCEKR
jgi:ribosomal-protein-serine acetyltransferase